MERRHEGITVLVEKHTQAFGEIRYTHMIHY